MRTFRPLKSHACTELQFELKIYRLNCSGTKMDTNSTVYLQPPSPNSFIFFGEQKLIRKKNPLRKPPTRTELQFRPKVYRHFCSAAKRVLIPRQGSLALYVRPLKRPRYPANTELERNKRALRCGSRRCYFTFFGEQSTRHGPPGDT